jgi:phosphate ABC transporter phosphate-binding protein
LLSGALGIVAAVGTTVLAVVPPASAVPQAPKVPAGLYQTISGAGSTWAANAINAWVSDVAQNSLQVNYAGVGSTTGRNDFKQATVNFAASEIPYGVQDGNNFDPPPARGFAYMPDVAGGTTFMYNLKIGASRVTNLRLSGKTIADIFTGQIQFWDNQEIKTDNPSLSLPHIQIVPVVRSDGSGATADFTQWMLATQPADWNHYCSLVGRNPCTQTSAYPVWSGDPAMVGQQGDPGVSGYVAQNQSNGAIGYVEYSYAIQSGFPVAKVLNAAGYYTEPTAGHVAVSLLAAKINMNPDPKVYLTEDLSAVYTNQDPRTYELSAYSYLILPTTADSTYQLTPKQGFSLGAFGTYLLCQGQQQVDNLGYSALPINLVQAGYAQLQKIPGAQITNVSASFIQGCNNPTFDPNGHNKLADNDPQPQACDKVGVPQCGTPTGGSPGSNNGGNGNNGNNPGNNNNGNNPGNNNNPGGNTPGANTPGSSTSPTSSNNPANPSGPNSSAALPPGAGAATCDPNTGVCNTAGPSGSNGLAGNGAGGQGNPVPISLTAGNDDGVQVALGSLCAAVFLALCIVPPLAANASDNRRRRRVAQWSAGQDGGDGPGGRR